MLRPLCRRGMNWSPSETTWLHKLQCAPMVLCRFACRTLHACHTSRASRGWAARPAVPAQCRTPAQHGSTSPLAAFSHCCACSASQSLREELRGASASAGLAVNGLERELHTATDRLKASVRSRTQSLCTLASAAHTPRYLRALASAAPVAEPVGSLPCAACSSSTHAHSDTV